MYCITVEQKRIISLYYKAADDKLAIEEGESIFKNIKDSDFGDGSTELDYAISNDNGETVEDWHQ